MRQFYLAEPQDGKRRRSLTANEYEISNRDRSPIKQLYMHGRFHASPVLMPNNDLVMSYVVRLGYDETR